MFYEFRKYLLISAAALATACSGDGSTSGDPLTTGTREEPESPCVRSPFDRNAQKELVEQIKFGNSSCVRELLRDGAKANEQVDISPFRDRDLQWPIHYAIDSSSLFFAKGDKTRVLRALVEGGADVNKRNSRGQTVLQALIDSESLAKHPKVAEYLVTLPSTDVELQDASGSTPLLSLLAKKYPNLVTLLIDRGANVKARTNSGATALDIAMQSKLEDIALVLLAKGVDPLVPDRSGRTALHSAAHQNLAKFVAAIAKAGHNLNVTSRESETPLFEAVSNGSNAAALELIRHGANVDLATNRKQTPLHRAIEKGDDELFKALLPKVTAIDAVDGDSQSYLALAVQFGKADQVQSLLARDPKTNTLNKTQRTPLMMALLQGRSDLVQLLVPKSNVETLGKDNVTALFFAQNINDAKALLDAGANLNAKTLNGRTPLSSASMRSTSDLAMFYIDNGADVVWKDMQTGATLLHLAVEGGNLALSRALLDKGLDINAKNIQAETPLHLVQRLDVLDLLLERNADVNPVALDKSSPLSRQVFRISGQSQVDAWGLVKRLVEKNANVKILNSAGQSLLQLTMASFEWGRGIDGDLVRLAEFLIKAGVNPNVVNSRRESLLHLVRFEVQAKVLVENGADRTLKNLSNQTALDVQRKRQTDKQAEIDTLIVDIQRVTDQIASERNATQKRRLEDVLASKKAHLTAAEVAKDQIDRIMAVIR